MGLEAGDLISNLNILWPLEDDPTHEGNEHFQLVKRVIQRTFPGRDGGGLPEGGWDDRTLVNPEELDLLIDATTPIKDTQDLIKLQTGVVLVGKDDSSAPMELHADAESGVIQVWDNGGPQIATVMNTLNVVDHIYPIGSYIDRDGSAPDPNVQYVGTTWEPVVGYVTVGAGLYDDGGPEETTFTVDTTGGEINHALTIQEMPAHLHRVGRVHELTAGGGEGEIGSYNLSNDQNPLSSLRGGPNDPADGIDNNTVDAPNDPGAGHNTMQPYIVVNKWKRTA